MGKISVYKDLSTELDVLDKGVLEIENSTNGRAEVATINFDIAEYSENGVEIRLLFRGSGDVFTPEVESPIISITNIRLEPDSEEIIIRLGKDDVKKIKVNIESSKDLFLEELEFLSKNAYILLKQETYIKEEATILSLDAEESKEYAFEIPLGEEVFSFRKKDIEEKDNEVNKKNNDPVSIEGKIFYVKATNSRLPRNICLNGIRIKLYNEDNKLLSTRITRKRGKENGHFKFVGLERGRYRVKFLIPCNLEIVKETCDEITDDTAYISLTSEESKYIKIGVIKRGE